MGDKSPRSKDKGLKQKSVQTAKDKKAKKAKQPVSSVVSGVKKK